MSNSVKIHIQSTIKRKVNEAKRNYSIEQISQMNPELYDGIELFMPRRIDPGKGIHSVTMEEGYQSLVDQLAQVNLLHIISGTEEEYLESFCNDLYYAWEFSSPEKQSELLKKIDTAIFYPYKFEVITGRF